MKKLMVAAALAVGVSAAPASAAVSFVVEGGGTPVVFEDNGNRFGLVGVRGDATGGTVDFASIGAAITSFGSNTLVNAFQCTDFAMGGSCSSLTSLAVASGQRIFDALLLEFSSSNGFTAGTNVVFGGTATLSLARVTRAGDPPISGAVPEPTTWAMMILGMGLAGAAMRRRKAAVRIAYA